MVRTVDELQVFQRAIAAADALFACIGATALGNDRDLRSQLNRASVRIVSNIAEGFEQKTDRHFARFLYDARGSAAEVRAQLLIARNRGLIGAEQCGSLCKLFDEIGRMLTGLITHLERDDRRDRRQAGPTGKVTNSKRKGEPE